jgi:hypothetical protein
MALGTNGFTQADLDVDIPEIWGQKINDYFRYSLDLASFFVDRSEELMEGGDTIHTPNLSALSVNAKSTNSQVTLSSPTYTDVDLVVSTWKEASFVIEDRELASVKRSYYLQKRIAEGGAYEVAQDLDDAIAALFAGFSTSLGATGANLADSNLLAAIATLETSGVPGIYQGDVAWIFHPNTFYRQIGSIDKLTLWQNTGSEELRKKQPTRMLYGIPVIVSPAVPNAGGSNGRVNAIAHKDAIHWARLSLPVKAAKGFVGDMGVRVQQSYVHEYLGDLVTIDLCYGVIENRDSAGVKLLSHATKA